MEYSSPQWRKLLIPAALVAVVLLILVPIVISSGLLARRIAWGLCILGAGAGVWLALVLRHIVRQSQSHERSEERLKQANAELEGRTGELERRTREMRLYAALASALRACEESEEAYGVIAKALASGFPGCRGAIYIINNSRNLMQPTATWGESRDGRQAFGPDDCCGLRTGRVHVAMGTQFIDCRHVAGHEYYLCAPLIAHGEALGTLSIEADSAAQLDTADFVSDAPAVAQAIAERAALAISSLRLRQALKDAAIRDTLTGLFNRRYMEETFARELARCSRNQSPLAVLMIDIDHFKIFNDRHGHDIGDLVLKRAGMLLKSVVRLEDIVCRYGGEEFVIIMPEADRDTVLERAEQLRLQFGALSISHGGTLIEPVTISVGAAIMPADGDTAEQLLLVADQRLYSAKSTGRNTVCVPQAQAMQLCSFLPRVEGPL